MGCAAIFLYSNTIDFMNATVVTTVDTMTVPLSEVFFPSVVVCNINQVGLLTILQYYNTSHLRLGNHSLPSLESMKMKLLFVKSIKTLFWEKQTIHFNKKILR